MSPAKACRPIYDHDAKHAARKVLDAGDFRLSDLSTDMQRFVAQMRYGRILRHIEETLYVYGYLFVRGEPSAPLSDSEAEAIGEICLRSIELADYPGLGLLDRRESDTRIRKWGYRYGATRAWQHGLFAFLEANNIGLVDRRDADKIYPDLVELSCNPYKITPRPLPVDDDMAARAKENA
jgi:hypothetical protein